MNDCVKEERRKRSNSVISPTSTIHFVVTCLHLIDKYELATATFGPVFVFFFNAAKFKDSAATRFKDADIESKGSLITAIGINRYIVVQLRYDSLFYHTTKKKKKRSKDDLLGKNPDSQSVWV